MEIHITLLLMLVSRPVFRHGRTIPNFEEFKQKNESIKIKNSCPTAALVNI